jgi:uncharacterized protein (DUF1330 family)
MSSAYIIANVEVTNPTQYEEYKKWSSVAMKAHGAEVCVRGGKVKCSKATGSPPRGRAQVRQLEKAKAFYDSPEYLKAREARAGAAIMRMIAVEGL